jgi:hypothetical protein
LATLQSVALPPRLHTASVDAARVGRSDRAEPPSEPVTASSMCCFLSNRCTYTESIVVASSCRARSPRDVSLFPQRACRGGLPRYPCLRGRRAPSEGDALRLCPSAFRGGTGHSDPTQPALTDQGSQARSRAGPSHTARKSDSTNTSGSTSRRLRTSCGWWKSDQIRAVVEHLEAVAAAAKAVEPDLSQELASTNRMSVISARLFFELRRTPPRDTSGRSGRGLECSSPRLCKSVRRVELSTSSTGGRWRAQS